MIEDNGARAGGSLIEGEDSVGVHGRSFVEGSRVEREDGKERHKCIRKIALRIVGCRGASISGNARNC